ncbi:MAG: ferrochelatase [Desulfobacteraceae bacterium]|jgi:protoheme ferro-lyase|nr:ferrochelatase [Desulfobacteraceae bacterium]
MKLETFQRFSLTLFICCFIALNGCSSDSSQNTALTPSNENVAVLFVGHGEPTFFEDGDQNITMADGSSFGPFGTSLSVPVESQSTEWAAAYEEIATAMTYIFKDLNGNGIPHEIAISPTGDVPPFFTWEAFHASTSEHYNAFNNYSPHNDTLKDLVEDLDINVEGAEIETYLAFLDAVPRIPNVIWEIAGTNKYKKLVVVPMLLSSSTHTQEVQALIQETVHENSDIDVLVVTEPFFDIPFMRNRLKDAIIEMAWQVRQDIPADVDDEDIAVVLASHGTPYNPPFPEFGWQEGEIFSNLILTEDLFHEEIAAELPWKTLTGRMNYADPPIEASIAELNALGYSHVMVIPSAFPTAAMHTMWDVAFAALGQAALPEDGVMVHTWTSGMNVYYSAQGFADMEPGRSEFRAGLSFIVRMGVMEALEEANQSDVSDDGTNNDGTGDSDGGDGSGDNGGSDETCEPGEICFTVTVNNTTGPDLKLMLYEATEEQWPQEFWSLPTPTSVVTESPPVPDNSPVHIRIPMADNLFTFSGVPLEGARLGLAIATGVASNMVVDPLDARGFSDMTLVYQPDAVMDYGNIELDLPAGDTCELNPFHPSCLTGPLLWQEHFLGTEDFVPGAVYMDTADIDGDGILDIVTVGEPHFEDPNLPLNVLKLGVYYMNNDLTVREMEIIDEWSEEDQEFYSPWGVNVIDHSGEPLIIVGTNIPGLAPLEEGRGAIFSYRQEGDGWIRSVVRDNPEPTNTNYNAMIVVTCDINADGDEDLALSGAFDTSAIGSWMENTGDPDTPWIPHLQPMADDTDPYIRGTLAYKCTDLNDDGYPEIIYNAMFDIADTDPPLYRGEIWLAVNPGPGGWEDPWQKIVIDDDNWASADMWFHDFNDDGYPDLIANQIFSSTVTRYSHPGENLNDPWEPEVIITGLTSPSDMWLADMDNDGLMDLVSADHTAHRGVWHKNPGPESSELWQPNLIYRNIRMPGDFAMIDLDEDGDLDWLGTSMTLGQAFIVEQVQPDSSLVMTVTLPDDFDATTTKLLITLADEIPVTGIPVAILATIDNVDSDGDGQLDVDQILGPTRDLALAMEDVGVVGDYHVVAALYVEGGGTFQPVPGVDYLASSEKVTLGQGSVAVTLDMELVPSP